jgi:hypothetical protein
MFLLSLKDTVIRIAVMHINIAIGATPTLQKNKQAVSTGKESQAS